MEKTNIFKCKPPEVHFTIRDRVPYNKLLTNLACSSRTVKYWPSVVFVRTSLRSVRTATTSGQYSPVRPSRSVSKRLLFELNSGCTVNWHNDIPDMLSKNHRVSPWHKVWALSYWAWKDTLWRLHNAAWIASCSSVEHKLFSAKKQNEVIKF